MIWNDGEWESPEPPDPERDDQSDDDYAFAMYDPNSGWLDA